jgi:hypothetical protein
LKFRDCQKHSDAAVALQDLDLTSRQRAFVTRLDPQIVEGSDVRLAWRPGDLRLLREDTAA